VQQVIQIALGVFVGGGMVVIATLAMRSLARAKEDRDADPWALWGVLAVSVLLVLMLIAVRPTLALP
jgi:hypothetical protein